VPDTGSPVDMQIVDDTINHEQADVLASDVPSVSSPDNTLAQLPTADKDVAQLTDSPKPVPVFTPASTKPRVEQKNDLSSMFKSLSAKMKMKHERQSRFSDIDTVTSAGPEAALSDASVSKKSTTTDTVSESTSVDRGADEDTVHWDDNSGWTQPLSLRAQNMPLAASDQSQASTFGLQDYVCSSLSHNDYMPSIPVFPQTAVHTSTQNSSIVTVMPSVPGLTSQLGLCLSSYKCSKMLS